VVDAMTWDRNRQFRVLDQNFGNEYLNARIFAHEQAKEKNEPVLMEELIRDNTGVHWTPLYYIGPNCRPISARRAVQKALSFETPADPQPELVTV
jgi:hypothetical protein